MGIIIIPPIVGVFLFFKCDDGPSGLMFCINFLLYIFLIPYFIESKDDNKDIRKIIDIFRFLKQKLLVNTVIKIIKNKYLKFENLIFPVIIY